MRDGTEKYAGPYNFKFTKDEASPAEGVIYLQDGIGVTDLHNLTAGSTYTFSLWVFVPTEEMALTEVIIQMGDYDGAWTNTSSSTPTIIDTWQKLSVTRTLRTTAAAVYFRIKIHSDASNTEFCYVDDIAVNKVPQIKIDAGTNNVISAKSFAIGGHNLTGNAKITIQGNTTADFDSPDFSDELERNLIFDSEDITTSNWITVSSSNDLTNMYVKNRRLTKLTATAGASTLTYQLQYPNNTSQSYQVIMRKGKSTVTTQDIQYRRATSPFTIYGSITITWATQAVTSSGGLTLLDYEWIDDETVWVSGVANSIDTSLLCRFLLYINPTEQTTGDYVYATAAMVEDNSTVTKYDEVHANIRTHVFSEASYRYWQILIEDFDNSDNYVEAGRIHLGDYLQTKTAGKGVSMVYEDTSSVVESLTGQAFGDERIIQKIYNLRFPYWTDIERKLIVEMVRDIKTVKPVFLIVNEDDLDKIVPVYARLSDPLGIDHIIAYIFSRGLTFKQVF